MAAFAAVPLDNKRLHEELDKLNYPQKIELPSKKQSRSNFRFGFPNVNLSFFKYIFYALALLALVYVIYIILKRVKYSATEVSLDNRIILGDTIPESEILRVANLEDMLNSETNAKKRIRLIFLLVLQAFVKKGLLDTNPSYTNGQYAQFLAGKIETHAFVQLTKVYELAWFGYSETLESDVNRAITLKVEILNVI
jgi:hypothetical protein